MSNNAHDLSNRLLNALDNNYNVVDMHAVNEIISILEKNNITKELLETTRLGKHVNELRRKTTDAALARRAKVLVKRWRDLVIPARPSPSHTSGLRSSAERQLRRGGTPLTSPALSRVVSPAVVSPRPPSRPAWGGYESDSQDVILVDDDPPPTVPPPATIPQTVPLPIPIPAVKRPPSPEPAADDKKAKRDKNTKKRRVREGWGGRNGARNGCDALAALARRVPHQGKKVKTTQELLQQIQSRGAAPPDADDDVVLLDDFDPPPPVKKESPLRNGGLDNEPVPRTPPPPSPLPTPWSPGECAVPLPLCTCDEGVVEDSCPAAKPSWAPPAAVWANAHCLVAGVNGTRAPRPAPLPARPAPPPPYPGLFTSVVPLYKYTDYADDYCVKNMSRVPLCSDLPWTEYAPPPPSPSPPPSPPPLRPYPEPEPEPEPVTETEPEAEPPPPRLEPPIEPEMVSVPTLEPSERLKAPILSPDDEKQYSEVIKKIEVCKSDSAPASPAPADREPGHRTVERTKCDLMDVDEVKCDEKSEEKVEIDGRALYAACEQAREAACWGYSLAESAPELPYAVLREAPDEGAAAVEAALGAAEEAQEPRDEFGRPSQPERFAEWHECACLGDLLALPYVVID